MPCKSCIMKRLVIVAMKVAIDVVASVECLRENYAIYIHDVDVTRSLANRFKSLMIIES